jgi:hypothetical protein
MGPQVESWFSDNTDQESNLKPCRDEVSSLVLGRQTTLSRFPRPPWGTCEHSCRFLVPPWNLQKQATGPHPPGGLLRAPYRALIADLHT